MCSGDTTLPEIWSRRSMILNEGHRFVHRPVKRHDTVQRQDFQIAGSRIRRGRHIDRRQFLARDLIPEDVSHEADGFHPWRRKFDQHDPLELIWFLL